MWVQTPAHEQELIIKYGMAPRQSRGAMPLFIKFRFVYAYSIVSSSWPALVL